jgi:hypothetical protein
VDLDATAIDEQSVRRISCSRQRAEDTFPDAALGPADEPIVEGFLRPIDFGAVGPTATAAKGMDDATQHTTIIHARLTAHIGRKKPLDASPLRIGKPKEISHLTTSSMRQ